MTRSSTRITGFPRLFTVGFLGGFFGLMVAGCWNPLPLGSRSRLVPAAYRVPKIPGGTPLRLAMVHDILHERYLRHGPAWYARRNLDARKIIAAEAAASPPSPAYLDALDDLAIGLEGTGQYDDAIATMRKKLLLLPPLPAPTSRPARPENDSDSQAWRAVDQLDLDRILASRNLSPIQHHQYTSCANLGTILVHSAMPKALAGDAQAKARVREGLDFIEQSIAINPGAHFGRETWQAIAIEHLLAATDNPDLLQKYDLIGDRLDAPGGFGGQVERFATGLPYSRVDSELTSELRLQIRSRIDRIGIDKDWAAIVHPDYSEPMPFDEPTLAIIGMWTLGAGPSPHFALALGRIMEDLGQREIAWNAYERAVELKDRFWPAVSLPNRPDPAICEEMLAICRVRQLGLAQAESSDAEAWQNRMRRQHTSELAWGIAFQKAYQDYEAAQIAAGVPLNDPNFYAAFFQNRPSIASAPGLSDDFILKQQEAGSFTDFLPCVVLGSGIAMAIALMLPEGSRGWQKTVQATLDWVLENRAKRW